MTKMIELTMTEMGPDEALASLEALRSQDGFVGGRVLGDGYHKPWRSSAFFQADAEHRPGEVITDSGDGGEVMRVVLVPSSVKFTVVRA